MNIDALKNTKNGIYIFGTSEELTYTAISLLWFLNLAPTAFIDEDVRKNGTFLFGIPVLSLHDALSGVHAPTLLLCSYSRRSCEKIMQKVSELSVTDSIFWDAYDIECAYIKEKRNMISFPEIEQIVGTDIFKSGTLSRYTCSVEQDYKSILKDIRQVATYSYAIKYLDIRTPSDLIDDEFVKFLRLVATVDNVLYITIRTDCSFKISNEILKQIQPFIQKFIFYHDSDAPIHPAMNFNSLIGCIPFSHIKANGYSMQTKGYDEQPLTITHLKEMIAEDLGIEIAGNSADSGEICFVTVCGGLGNQILYYLLACLISEHTSKLVIVDDTKNQVIASCSADVRESMLRLSYNNLNQKNIKKAIQAENSQSMFLYEHLELYEIFSCKLKRFSELFDSEVLIAILNKLKQYATRSPLFSYLSALDCKMAYYSDRYTYNRSQTYAKNYIAIDKYYSDSPQFSEHFWLTAPMKNSYYYIVTLTNFQFWDESNRLWAQTKLKFPPIEDKCNQHISAQIAESDSVVLHIRRGDAQFLDDELVPNPEDYYRDAIHAIEALGAFPSRKYFIFSDDIPWCQTHKRNLGLVSIPDNEIIYVSHNTGKASFRDMQLLSMGKIMVFPPSSTFSFCAFILSSTVKKYISYQHYKNLCSSGLSAEEIRSRLIQDA